MKSVSVVVPCFNEADGIPQLREKLNPALDQASRAYDLELVFVDDGSTDDTHRLLNEAFGHRNNTKVVRHKKNHNLGRAIRTGIQESSGEWIANLDSDCTYDPSVLEPMLQAMEQGADLVSVSPYHPQGQVVGVPPHRLFLSKSLTAMYRLILRKRIFTFTALARVYKRSVVPQIQSPASDFTCVAEMMLKALKQNLQVAEVPTSLSVRKFGESKMKTAKVIQAHLKLVKRLVFDPASFSP
jgi:dolichol-phosphate mannosyltransferase